MTKKIFPLYLVLIMILSLISFSIKDVSATDFASNEAKYISLCSSSNITRSNESVCREFNTYLKKKNASLQNSIKETNNNINSTKNDIDGVVKKIESITNDIAEKEQEIVYLQSSIDNLKASIKKKENEVKKRMYSQQSYSNSNSYIDYIFGASSFTDIFSRIESVNEITDYDNNLIEELAVEKQQVESQQAVIKTAKANLEGQKTQQITLQNQYQALFEQQNAQLLQQQQQQQEAENQQGKLDAALSLLVVQTQSTSHGVTGDSSLGQSIANKALSKQGCMYLWGGCHSMSEISNPATTRFDCSGLVSWAFYQAGKNIGSNTTSTLVGKGMAISSSQLQAGDIVLFNSRGTNSVCHVGIAINNSQMVHAPQTGSPVQVSDLTSSWRSRVNSYRRLY